MQVREKVGVAKRYVFPMIRGSGGSKSRLAKVAGAEPAGQMRDEKLHAVVARSTFPSQNVQSTSAPDHFWKLRCRKSACRCGAKHISKSKCTKHTILGPLLEIEMSKKCTPLWRERHFEVKMLKTPGVRTTFGSWDVEKVHAIVARSTFRSQNVQSTPFSDHFGRSDAVSRGRRKGLWTLSKVRKRKCAGFVAFSTTTTTTPPTLQLQRHLHYIPLHYTTLTTLHSITLDNTQLHYTTLHYKIHYTTLHYTTLHYTPLHNTTLHYTTIHYIQLHYTPFYNYFTLLSTTTLHYIPLHYTPLHSITLHYTTLHYTTLHYTTITVRYTTLHCTTLHYITLHHTNYNNNNYIRLQYTTLHCTTLHPTPLHYTHYTTLHSITLHYTTYTTRHYTTLHYTTLRYATLHCTTLHYTTHTTTTTTIHYIALHYTTTTTTTTLY